MLPVVISKRKLLGSFLVLVIAVLSGCANCTPKRRITVIEDCNLQSNCLRIKNRGNETSTFKLKLNNGFYLSKQEMLDSIVRLSNQTGMPLEKAAWSFVSSLTINDKPLTQKSWQHRPEVFINSIGSGYCDDEAAILASIWGSLGFEARCWLLDGHVVPEVCVSGKWQMFDPSLKSFYLDSNGWVSSVEELTKHPEYVLNDSILKNPDNPFLSAFSNSSYIAELYSSTENNRILTGWETAIKNFPAPIFSLPPGSIIEFPGVYICRSTPKMLDAQVRLSIPPYWSGTVNSPLVIEKIEGQGEIILENQSFSVGSNALDSILAFKADYYHNFTILTSTKPIIAYYLINPLSLEIRDKNKIELFGCNLDNIEVSCSSIDNSFSIKNSVSANFVRRTIDDYNYYLSRDATSWHKSKIDGPHSLADAVDSYLNYDDRLTTAIRDSLEPLMKKAIFEAEFAEQDSVQKTKLFNETKGFVLFMSVIKNSPQ